MAARGDRKRLERELADLHAEADRRPLRRRAIRTPAPSSRIAPPEDGAALWTVRAVALGLVVLLLVAIALVVIGLI